MNKIFQIGFNKCGTTSLYDLFSEYTNPKIKCVHWDYGKLALSIKNNLNQNIAALSSYEDFVFFSDMESYSFSDGQYRYDFLFKYFDVLDNQYPKSKFILNTRDINKWIISRLNHINDYIIKNNTLEIIDGREPYYISYMKSFKIKDLSDLVLAWTNEWYEHHNIVMNYFKDRPKDLLVFNIDTDNLDKIKSFFPQIQFLSNKLPHSHKTQ